ncbi:hypothetical protein CMI39_02090 [Candidatus Pacearchaeota archaeon]|nr:hypothetical protein [Candidatus Pacearchaeota archaeon]|tara:strand:+ start:3423 stop:3719 length:297 start_codon:yes stop_codon:yes gene_type:complete
MELYDVIMFYCPQCYQRNEHRFFHPEGKQKHYHATNIPLHVAVNITSTDVLCKGCQMPLNVCLEDIPAQQYNLLVRLDCSNMGSGMESWYSDYGRGYD